ncbi:MAG: rhodanese-like domain-containing protein [Vampirovibrionales bacterium]
MTAYQHLSHDELRHLMTTVANLQLIDVRTSNEFHTLGHIAGSRCLPVQEIQQWAGTLDPTCPTVCLCQGGVRSVYACDYLAEQAGFRTLYNSTEGMNTWDGEVVF